MNASALNGRLTFRVALQEHWPEYLIEAWALGMFMISAGVAVVMLESAALPLREAIGNADLRRAFIGIGSLVNECS